MEVTVLKGKLITLGDALVSTDKTGSITTYSYIEMESGEVFKKVIVASGLNGKLQNVLNDDYTEIHLLTGKEKSFVLAIKDARNRIYAIDAKIEKNIIVLTISILISSISFLSGHEAGNLISGFLFLSVSYFIWSRSKRNNDLVKYIDSLTGAIKI